MQVKYIPDCFYHSKGSGLFPSHEAICVINDHTEPVNLRITLYFEDRAGRCGAHAPYSHG